MTSYSNSHSSLLASGSSTTTSSTAVVAAPKMSFTTVASSLSEEANRIRSERKLSGPGSEYTNIASDTRANQKTGIRMHKANPKGIACENPACAGLPRSLTHDREHCFQPGGGMEGKGGNPTRTTRKPFKKDIAAAATSEVPAAKSKTSSPNQSDSDLACAIIEELPDDSTPSAEDIACIVRQSMSTILDSGTTSTLITDREYFWTFSTDSRVTVKTANHGRLPTSGRGDCVADLRIGGKTRRLRLTNCLHAPGAMVNLLSVGYMVEKGWAVNFLPGPARCQLVFQSKCIGEIPMTGKL
ncbi:hypothetical protein P692DRAFT_20721321, partial [Suillus brevipes Sb2]